MPNLKSLPVGEGAPEVVQMVVEVPRGSGNKYEYDPGLGVIRLDRVLPGAQFYPGDYGFIPSTLAEDGDPLDGLIFSTYPLLPGVVVEVRPIGLLLMEDEKGADAKVLAVVKEDPRLDHLKDVGDLSEGLKEEIQHFFETYKALEAKKGKWVRVTGFRGREAALEEIRSAIRRYQEAH